MAMREEKTVLRWGAEGQAEDQSRNESSSDVTCVPGRPFPETVVHAMQCKFLTKLCKKLKSSSFHEFGPTIKH